MRISKQIFALLVVLVFGLFAFVEQGHAATIISKSVSYSDVSAAISSASPGDTVIVPSGSATWSSQLLIQKAITLQGNGIGNTVITSGQGSGTVMVQYTPANPQNDGYFRVTGFTFDGSQNSIAVEITNSGDTYRLHNIRVDHNRFYHCSNAGVVFGYWNGGGGGRVSGVVDSNTFDDCLAFTRAYGSYETSWKDDPLDLGGPTGMYVEDNIMTMSSAWCSAHPSALHHASSGWGGRYVYRFNRITYHNGDGWQDGFDVHGKQACDASNSGSVSTEIYGNTISYGVASRFLAARGGQARVFNNTLTNAPQMDITDENYSRPGMQCCKSWPCPEMVHSYFWNNINNGSDITRVGFFYNTTSPKDSEILHENRDYWLPKTAFDGSSGIGRGLWADRPVSCKTETAYWASDSGGDWNKANGDANDGALYICTDNAWPNVNSPSYVPYAYPHPLRNGEGSVLSVPEIPPNARVEK